MRARMIRCPDDKVEAALEPFGPLSTYEQRTEPHCIAAAFRVFFAEHANRQLVLASKQSTRNEAGLDVRARVIAVNPVERSRRGLAVNQTFEHPAVWPDAIG